MGEKRSADYIAANLLCDEEAESLKLDDGFLGQTQDFRSKGASFINGGKESEPSIELPLQSDEYFGWMIEREKNHLPRYDYLERLSSGELDSSSRQKAIDWIFKACFRHDFGEICLCSAVNYFDRFLSEYDLPKGNPWAPQLVAVASLLLAAKVDEVNVPNVVDLQCGFIGQQEEPKFLFEPEAVHRMEILLLNNLKWNIKPHTPLNFLDFFLCKINNEDHLHHKSMIARSFQLVSTILKGIDFLEFRPSEIAAAMAIQVSGEIQGVELSDKELSCFTQVQKDKVMKCLQLLQGLIIPRNYYSATTTSSPSTVTAAGEAICSHKSDAGSCASSPHSKPDCKRRKTEKPTVSEGDN